MSGLPSTVNEATRLLNRDLFAAEETPETRPARTNARNDGREFQGEIERSCGFYNSHRIATVRKCDPPIRIVWTPDKITKKPVQRVIFLQNPFLDYIGTWTARGARMLCIEAKSTSYHLLRFNADNGFKDKQWAAMKSWHWSGAACALLWKFNGKVMLFTPAMLFAVEATKAKSLKHEDGLRVEPGVGSLVWDFLPILAK